jgi:large subunit ribosomal protein L15
MRLNAISDNPGARKKRFKIGRGIGSGKGKTGGRGGKGQTARSGVRIKGFEGGQMPIHRRLPKRGFRNTAFAVKLNEINLGDVQAAIDAGKLDATGKVDAEALVKAGLLRRAKDGVRLLGSGELKAKVEFSVYGASKSAVAAVEKAGGSVAKLAPVKEAPAEPKGKNALAALKPKAEKPAEKPEGEKAPKATKAEKAEKADKAEKAERAAARKKAEKPQGKGKE